MNEKSAKKKSGSSRDTKNKNSATAYSAGIDRELSGQKEDGEDDHGLFDNMAEGYAYCRMTYENGRAQDWVFIKVNDSFEKLTGLKNVVGKRATEIRPDIHKTDPKLLEICSRVSLTGQPEKFETFVEALQMWFSVSVFSPGRESFVMVFDAIAERKEVEAKLRESRERFRTVANFTYDWEYWQDDNRQLLYTSPSCERITGYDVGKFEQDPSLLEKIVHPDDRPLYKHHIREEIEKTEPISLDFRILTVDGDIRWISHACQRVYDTDGHPMGRRASNRDITQRRQAEQALQENEAILKMAEEVAQMGSWRLDLRTKKSTWSEQMFRLFGMEREGFNGDMDRVVAERVHSDDVSSVLEFNRNILKGISSVASLTYRIVLPDGTERMVRAHGKLIRDQAGRPTFMTGYLQDITEWVQVKRQTLQMKRLYATLSQVNQTIVRVKDAAELYQSICDVSVQYGELAAAWVGLLDDASGKLLTVAANGLDMKNWLLQPVDVNGRLSQNEIITEALRTSKPATSEDVQTDERTEKLRDHLKQTNFHSLASIPFRLQGRTIGVLNLLSRDVGSFEAEEEINLFDEMGLDISFALDRLEVEKVKRQWADAFEHCAHGIAIGLPSGRLLTCNPAFARQQGGTVEEISSMSILEMYERSEHEYIKQRIAEADHAGHVQFEANKVRKDGSTYPVQMDLVSVRDEDGSLLYRVVTQEDITERKRAEEAIAALAKFPSENPNPVLRVDGNGIILYANPASVPILNAWGRETGQALSNDWRERVASSLRSARIDEVEMDCNGRLFSCILAPIIDDGYVNIYGRDVTEHRQAEAERRNFYDTLNASLNELYIFDAETLIFQFVSNGALRNLGYSLDEMRGMTPLDLKPSFTLTSFNDLIAPLRRQEEQVINFETFHRRADDSLYPVEVHLQLLERGEGQAFLAVILDITERKLAEKQIQVQLNRMRALNEIDRAISSSLDMRLSLDTLLDKVLSQLEVDAASVLVLNSYSQTLEYEAGKGFHSPSIRESQMRLGQGLAGRVGLERKVVHITDLAALGNVFLRQELLKKEEFVEYFGVPLIAKGILKGVLEVFHRTHLNPNLEWINYLETLGGQAAIAIDNAQLFEGMQRSNLELVTAYDATIEGWSRAMDLRDKETEGHTLRVTEITVKLAKKMRVNQQEVAHMRRGALLHDIGKLGIPDHILLKPDKLSEVEWAIMRQHPKHAFNMLMPINYLRPALDIPYCHHEKWNGAGYPRGLKGEDIPLVARIFAVVDVWDALRSDRPYRASWPAEKVREYIIEESGTHFDPQVVRVFLELLDEDPSLQ